MEGDEGVHAHSHSGQEVCGVLCVFCVRIVQACVLQQSM